MSSYVKETQSRGAGAIAAHDLGTTAKASGSRVVDRAAHEHALIARRRPSHAHAPLEWSPRAGKILPQPTREIEAVALAPRLRGPVFNYNRPGSRTVEQMLISRPGGARVIAGVIEGNPPSAVRAMRRKHVRDGRWSAAYTPRSALMGLGLDASYAEGLNIQAEPTPTLRISPDRLAPTATPTLPSGQAIETPESIAKRQAIAQVYADVRAAYDKAADTEAGMAAKGAPAGARAVSLYGGDLVFTGVLGASGRVHRVVHVVNKGLWRVDSEPYWPPSRDDVIAQQAAFNKVQIDIILGRVCNMLLEDWQRTQGRAPCMAALQAPNPSPYGSDWQKVAKARVLAYVNSFSEKDDARPKKANVDRAIVYIGSHSAESPSARPEPPPSCKTSPDGSVFRIRDNRTGDAVTGVCRDGEFIPLPPGIEPPSSREEREGWGQEMLQQMDTAAQELEQAARNKKIMLYGGIAAGIGVAVLFLTRKRG